MQKQIQELVKRKYLALSARRVPGNEAVPRPNKDEAIVFIELFNARLQMLCTDDLFPLLEKFGVQLHHLTPSAIAQQCKYVWATRLA